MADVLPSCTLRESKGETLYVGPFGSVHCVPVFCPSCGVQGALTGKVNDMMPGCFWMCDDCVAKHGPPPGSMMMPDQLFMAELANEQLERAGRYLENHELAELLVDGGSWLSKLARDRFTTDRYTKGRS